MKKYKNIFKESNNSSSVSFINKMKNPVEDYYESSFYSYYIADYDPNLEEVVSKYEEIEKNKIIPIQKRSLDTLFKEALDRIQISAKEYTIENGFMIIRLYSLKRGQVPCNVGDKNWQIAIENKEMMRQDLVVITVKKVSRI